ncbi:MAG: DUF362 domain-containing protein [Phycisphaerae bacterium]
MSGRRVTRRTFLKAGAAVVAGGATVGVTRYALASRPKVHIEPVASYSADLKAAILASMRQLGVTGLFAGKRVALKPNLVETAPVDTAINTNPAVVRAVAEVIRDLDARDVFVAEGAGHRRDSELVLDQSGLGEVLDAAGLRFCDLNVQEVQACENRGGRTRMEQLFLPLPLLQADVIVSLAKLKTHHWAGATLSMKNFFGVMPGIVYGWPKNRLHVEGIPESIVDIVATVRPHLGIVDGVVGMEGDGPIMGRPKSAGVLVAGTNLPALDATCCRIMSLDPTRIDYLKLARRNRLGPIHESAIAQTGVAIEAVRQDFGVLEHLAHIKA